MTRGSKKRRRKTDAMAFPKHGREGRICKLRGRVGMAGSRKNHHTKKETSKETASVDRENHDTARVGKKEKELATQKGGFRDCVALLTIRGKGPRGGARHVSIMTTCCFGAV